MLTWSKLFETNIESVDRQHRYLVDLINDLSTEVIAQLQYDNYDKIMSILTELKKYTIEHFRQEEQLMKDNMAKMDDETLAEFWPFFKDHKAQHADFIKKIEEIFDKDVDESQDDVSAELIGFLAEWLKNHIFKVDMQLRKYIK
ncbi:bacteriohemerythrin [Alkaliphilus transvaalensis]|uniref:bacteriohemerythrin n=1 Tax=Alkaliphilus transvaalensis TaxID=114628 RepID=UPI0004789449|nr:bacteriohemerythrin [Alkaliphilus transvaalensis]